MDGVYAIERPAAATLPVVFASPHSGTDYSADFKAASRLDPLTLRRSEDSFVDEIFAAAPEMGAPLIKALFPRAYVDPNREPFELDAEMFADPLPSFVNTHSPRIAAGLGTIARVVASGEEIYRDKLTFEEAEARIDRLYRPYHQALQGLIEETRARFGWCLLIDCHSMPSIGGPMDQDPGMSRVDFVLGDCFGAACDGAITRHVEAVLGAAGYTVTRNIPYSGGFTTVHYGRPASGVHALQIEINRSLYMDETAFTRGPGLKALAGCMKELAGSLSGLNDPIAKTG
ncbi:MAG: N-formylglutamate amidohydrolase [Alphaproteobacteria bacterium]|nr:N-formylglutamate amidohydrolase [Alphaproteobacteria bacterium]